MSIGRRARCVLVALAVLALPRISLAQDSQPGPASGIFPAEDHDPIAREGWWGDRCRLEDGSYVTVQMDTSQPEGRRIVVQRFDARGNPLGNLIQPNTDAVQGIHRIACNDRGDFVVAWVGRDDGDTAELFRTYSRDGGAHSPVTRTIPEDDPAYYDVDFLDIAISPDGIVVATFDAYFEDALNVTVRSGNGVLLRSHEALLSEVEASGSAVACDRHGNALVSSDGKLRMLTDLQSGGRPLGEPFAVRGSDGAEAPVAAIEALSPGLFLALWAERETGWLGTLVTADGSPVAGPSIPDPAADASFTRTAVAGGPRAEDLGNANWEPIRGRPWPSAPRIAKGNSAWVMARIQPTFRGWDWADGLDAAYKDFSFDVVLQRSVDGGRTWGERTKLWQPEWMRQGGAGIPDVAGDGRGHFVAVWFNDTWEPLPYRVQLQAASSTDDGKSWSAPTQLYMDMAGENDAVPYAGPARVATDGRGTWVAVWGEYEWDYDHLREVESLLVARSVDDGATWSVPSLITVDQGYGVHGLDIEWDGRGRWVIAWSDEVVRTATSTDGEGWSGADVLTSTEVPAAVEAAGRLRSNWYPVRRDVSLASDGNGRVLLAASSHAVDPDRFGDDDDVFAWTLESGSSRWSSPRPIALQAGIDGTDDTSPVASADGKGGWIVAWHAAPGGTVGLDGDILLSRSRNGRSWDPVTTIAAMEGADPGSDFPGDLVTSGGVSLLSWATTGEEWAAGVRIAGDSCGNGQRDEGEACDDGNTADGDSCNRNCAAPACGNAAVDPGEECDDGNEDDFDSCTTNCTTARCGDGFLRFDQEQCDDGNDEGDDSCVGDCRIATCGDGFVHEGVEACDDGNWTNNDACLSCQLARCGDGVLNVGVEECDDGNTSNGDRCTNECREPRCGDGVVSITEECDPVGTGSSDFCTPECLIADCPDADGSGSVTTADAVRILGRAVGFDVSCPPGTCDANSNHRIDVTDARLVLRFAVGIVTDGICQYGGEIPPADAVISFSVTDPRPVGRLQVTVRYGSSKDLFNPFGAIAHPCATDIAGATAEFTTEEGRLDATIVVPAGVSGTTEMFHCSWYGGASPLVDGFSVSVKDAVEPDGADLRPAPRVDIAVQ